MASLPLRAISHGPLPRATETAHLIGVASPDVPVHQVPEVDDYVPPFDGAPPELAARLTGETPEPDLAAAVLARFARPAGTATHELIVTHSFQVAWFVRDALGAPEWRWMTMNAANCALTTILYRDDRPPTLIAFNDLSHLPPELRWTGFPPTLIPH